MENSTIIAMGAFVCALPFSAMALDAERENLSFEPLKSPDAYTAIETPRRWTAESDEALAEKTFRLREQVAGLFWGLAAEKEREANKARFVSDMFIECAKTQDAFDKQDCVESNYGAAVEKAEAAADDVYVKFTCSGGMQAYNFDIEAFRVSPNCVNVQSKAAFSDGIGSYGHYSFDDPYVEAGSDSLGIYLGTADKTSPYFQKNFSKEKNREIEKAVRDDGYSGTFTIYGRAVNAVMDPKSYSYETQLVVAVDGFSYTPRDKKDPIFTWSFDEEAPEK